MWGRVPAVYKKKTKHVNFSLHFWMQANVTKVRMLKQEEYTLERGVNVWAQCQYCYRWYLKHIVQSTTEGFFCYNYVQEKPWKAFPVLIKNMWKITKCTSFCRSPRNLPPPPASPRSSSPAQSADQYISSLTRDHDSFQRFQVVMTIVVAFVLEAFLFRIQYRKEHASEDDNGRVE